MKLSRSCSIIDRTLHVHFLTMDSPLKVLFAICLTIFTVSDVFSISFLFQRIEIKSGFYISNHYNVSLARVTKLNRTTYAQNFTMTLI